MRRFRFVYLVLATAAGVATAAAAEGGGTADPPPSLEYRPKRQVVPEPKAPTPARPVTIFRESIGSFGIGTGSFDSPVDVALDTDSNLFVLDAGNSRIQMFDRFSTFLFAEGRQGSRKGEFDKPRAIAFDPMGSLYVVDTGNHRIQKFNWVDKNNCPECPARPDGKRLQFHSSWGSLGTRSGDFKSPVDITFDASGNSYVLDAGNERVQIFDTDQHFVREWGRLFGDREGVYTGLVSLAWSRDRFGYLYLLGAGCMVQQFQLDGTLVNSWPAIAPDSGLCTPARIEIDNKNDYVYVLDAGNGLFMRFNLQGRFLAAWSGAERPFSNPRGMAVNPDRDDVLIADTENHAVQKFTLR